ncbi:alpha/beta hydrolase-fold protein [uncultured Ottowia sp.]|uniref:alpha/beta hydrolase-fold protein n=1 Tax=uncultured Ottowia sp. TaxID=543067 RepID=UPI002599182D|nr:alpha/beta hydrolase-fold protein [uncultured Ottowia sp.]
MALNLLLFLMRRRMLAASALAAGVLAVGAPGPAAFAALPDAARCSLLPKAATPCGLPLAGHALELRAAAGQALLWRLDGGSRAWAVRLTGPDGRLLRFWPAAQSGGQRLGWVTREAGIYRLEAVLAWPVADEAGDAASAPVWRLLASGPARRAAASAQAQANLPPASPRLRALQAGLARARSPGRKKRLLSEFWQAVQAQGAPLLEEPAAASAPPAPSGDAAPAAPSFAPAPAPVLVTFLWRAPPGTAHQRHEVRLDWPVPSTLAPALRRLPGTDVWHLSLPLPRGLRMAYQLVIDPVQWPAPGPHTRLQQALAAGLGAQLDPLNPRVWHAGSPGLAAGGEAARYAWRSALDIPAAGPLRNAAAPASYAEPAAEPALAGTLAHQRFASRQLGNTRDLSIYLPPGAHAAGSLPLALVFDRAPYLRRVRLPQLLDAAIAQGRLPPLAAVLIGNAGGESRARELPPHGPAFARMVATELLPWLRERHPALTGEARRVIAAGSSYGGLAAAWLGWAQPQAVGQALSLSGSFWWGPQALPPAPAWAEGDWLARQIATARQMPPTRWHLAWGLLEQPTDGMEGLADSNRRLRDVLQARGLPVSVHEYAGGHDYYAWCEEMLLGLQSLLAADEAAGGKASHEAGIEADSAGGADAASAAPP